MYANVVQDKVVAGILVIVGFVFFACAGTAHAATLSLTPSSGTYAAGETLTASLVVTSADQAINAVSGTVTFPKDLLEVLSISKANSILTLWVQEPSFSNAAGTLEFAGVVPNPGYSGVAGNLITVRFRARATGTASLAITSAETLANDGSGTNVLKSVSGSTLTISTAKATPQPSEVKEEKESMPGVESGTGLQPPIITSASRRVPLGGIAQITGSSIYPDAMVELTLQGPGGILPMIEGLVGANGVFSLTQQHSVIPGEYIGSVIVRKGGEQSSASEPFVIMFGGESIFSKILVFLVQPILLVTYGLIATFAVGLFLGRYFFRSKRLAVHDSLHDVDVEVHKSFLTLRERINESIIELQKEGQNRKLTEAEARFIKQMAGTIKDTEKAIEKEVQGGGK